MSKETARAKAFAAHRRGDFVTAEQFYSKLLQSTPSDAELLHNMGVLCYQAGRAPESEAWLRRTLAIVPGSLPTLQLLIRVYDETGDAGGALRTLDQYLVLRPDDMGMLNLKGRQLVRLGRLVEAEQAFRQATETNGSPSMFHDLGVCRQLLGKPSAAADAYQEAIRLGSTQPKTQLWLAQSLRAAGRTKEYYEAAIDAARSVPDDIAILTEAQSARRYVCDWDGFEQHQPRLLASLRHVLKTNGGQDMPPGIFNFLEVDEEIISAVARRYAQQISTAGIALQHKLRTQPLRDTQAKIRLGYLSSDFFTHAVGSLIRDLFACHDRERFEIYGYSLRHQPDAVQTCIQQGCDTYRNLSGRNAEQITRVIYDDQIDILIDLVGYTSAGQPTVLAAKPASVQIAWLGYLGTSGGEFMDYIIADDIVLPPALAQHYTERIIRLPCFLVTSPLPIADRTLSRQDAGLGEEGFVFCSFNQPYKLDRTTFGAWMEILRSVPGSKLWLYAPDAEVCGYHLRREAARLNVAPERLVFAPRAPMAEHMARMALADLALDPFHISGGATSVAILSAGVPILTLRGNSFLARMGSSINTRLGMDELDCTGPEQYVAKAIQLATTPPELIGIKNRLGWARQTGSFFNTRAFVYGLEKALIIAWDRHLAGQPPADIQGSESIQP